jgi:hypothetical protein
VKKILRPPSSPVNLLAQAQLIAAYETQNSDCSESVEKYAQLIVGSQIASSQGISCLNSSALFYQFLPYELVV